MNNFKKIVVPIDGSVPSLCAIIPALNIAKRIGLKVLVVLISSEVRTKKNILSGLNISEEDLCSIIIEQYADDFAQTLIKTVDKNTALVVISAYSLSYNIQKTTSGVVKSILEEILVPILVIYPDSLDETTITMQPKNILIPLDGTPGSSIALEESIKLFSRSCLSLRLLHITPMSCPKIESEGEYKAPYYQDYQQLEWPSWSKEFIKRFVRLSKEMQEKFDMKLDHIHGEPAEVILKAVETHNIEFIALAWHGIIGEKKALTLQKMLKTSKLPLLLVKIID